MMTPNKTVFNLLHSNAKGGIEQMFLNYTKLLQNIGYQLVCIVPPDCAYLSELTAMKTTLEFIDVNNYYDIFASLRLQKLIKKYQPVFLFSHKGRSHSMVQHWQRFFAKKHRPVTIGVCHGCHKRMANFDAVIVVSQFLIATFQQQNYQGKLFHLSNFMPTNDILPNNPQIGTKNLPLKNQQKCKVNYTLGILGRLSPEKNIDLALHALARIKQQQPQLDFSLIIAGDGDEKAHLLELTQQLNLTHEVQFIGWITDKAIFFQQIDALLLPSTFESFGMIILEAFNHHTPVIASRVGGPAEIIHHGKNGLLFTNNDVIDLTKQFIHFMNNPKLAEQLSEQGYTSLIESYSETAAIVNLKNILQTLSY